ncbi:MAG TPA: hypothetical protein VK673_20350, partial [Chthoniobacterales bacterium]|nr:hypothetical protein [Chthoniobacterales bacterium]
GSVIVVRPRPDELVWPPFNLCAFASLREFFASLVCAFLCLPSSQGLRRDDVFAAIIVFPLCAVLLLRAN